MNNVKKDILYGVNRFDVCAGPCSWRHTSSSFEAGGIVRDPWEGRLKAGPLEDIDFDRRPSTAGGFPVVTAQLTGGRGEGWGPTSGLANTYANPPLVGVRGRVRSSTRGESLTSPTSSTRATPREYNTWPLQTWPSSYLLLWPPPRRPSSHVLLLSLSEHKDSSMRGAITS